MSSEEMRATNVTSLFLLSLSAYMFGNHPRIEIPFESDYYKDILQKKISGELGVIIPLYPKYDRAYIPINLFIFDDTV